MKKVIHTAAVFAILLSNSLQAEFEFSFNIKASTKDLEELADILDNDDRESYPLELPVEKSEQTSQDDLLEAFEATSLSKPHEHRFNYDIAEKIQQSSVPLTITTPGTYTVTENLKVSKAESFAIKIATNNVTIDMGHHTINGSNTGANGIIVLLPSNIMGINITIKNGSIRNMTDCGVKIATPVTMLGIENINVNSAAIAGFQVLGSSNFIIRNCTARFCGYGFRLTKFGTTPCDKCAINWNIATNSKKHGFYTDGLSNSSFTNCDSHLNTDSGFSLLDSDHVDIVRCHAHENTKEGFEIATSSGNNDVSVVESFAYENGTTGFAINGNQQTINYCHAKRNVTGFSIAGTLNTFTNNTAKTNTGTGILLDTTSAKTHVQNNVAIGNATGISDTGTAANNKIYSNFAHSNTTNFSATITNVTTSPSATTSINFTSNIAE